MIAMFKSDMACLAGMRGQIALLSVFVGVLFAVCTGSLGALAACTVMVPLSLVSNLVAFDEQNCWQRYRMTLPLTRGQVVAGRFLSAAALVGLGLLVGVAACVLSYGIALLVPQYMGTVGIEVAEAGIGAWSLPVADAVATVALTAACGVAFALLMQAFTLVPAMRFGFTKAVRYLPVAATVVVVLALIALNAGADGGDAAWLAAVADGLDVAMGTPGGVCLVALGVVVAAGALYVLAGLLAARLYANREL